MDSNIRIGFSMHPRWARAEELEAFILPLRQSGLSLLEFELDDHQEDWPIFEPLMKTAFQMGLGLSFHAPYRPPYSLIGFASQERRRIQDDYRPMLEIAETWAQKSQSCKTLVIHAAVAHEPVSRETLIDDTLAFLTWVVEEFPELQLALENNHPARLDEVKPGVEPEDVLSMVTALDTTHLGVCWDIGHDYLRQKEAILTREWLSRVVHVHVHDVNNRGEDHYPLIFGRVPYKRWLGAWKMMGGGGSVVLELKGKHLQNWSPIRVAGVLEASVSKLKIVLG
jgi:sugar phosphate isomerase/epimerase